MSPQAQAKYDRAIASILAHGLAHIQGEAMPSQRCRECGKTKGVEQFHPDGFLWGALCLRCWSLMPGVEREHG